MKHLSQIILFVFTVSIIAASDVQGVQAAEKVQHYLLHTDANIQRLKKLIEADAYIKEAWQTQLQKAEGILRKKHAGTPDLQELSLAFRMTNDSRFLNKIKQILIENVNKETWEGRDLLNRDPAWKGGLGTAHTTFYMALGYNCVYGSLSSKERKQIAEGIVKLGIEPAMNNWLSVDNNFHTLDNMGHNWWSACVYMAGFASLAVMDEIPEASDWVWQISETIDEWVGYSGSILQNKPASFDSDGGFYEGINYAAFGFSQYLLFRYAWMNMVPGVKLPEVPEMEKMVDFFIYSTYYPQDKALSVNFGDSRIEKNGNAVVLLLWNMGYQNKNYTWYLQHTIKGNDKELLEANTPNGLVLYPELPVLPKNYVPQLPLSKLYSDMGWATLRNSWSDNATMLAVKCGFTWNHAHADAGSYILFHNGKYLIIDSGNSSYSAPEYTKYYCQSEAHNVALSNGKAQNSDDPYFGVKNYGHLYNLIEQDNLKYVYADATGPTARYFSRNFRHFLWIGDVILVIDDLKSYEPGKFEWLLHYNGESKRKGLDLSIRDENAEVLVRPLYPETFPDGGLPHDFPEKMRFEEKIGLKDHDADTKQPYWSISHFEQTDRTKFITAIILKTDENKYNLSVIERFEGKDMLGVRIHQDNKVIEVYLNLLADGRIKHRPNLNTFNGWTTDAYLLALTYDEGAEVKKESNIKQMFIAHGSFLRNDNITVIHALSKFFAAVDYTQSTPTVDFQGQDNVSISLWSPSQVSSIQFNKEKKTVNYNKQIHSVELKIHSSK